MKKKFSIFNFTKIIFSAKNCSSKPYPMPMDDKGMYDWDGESRKYQTVRKTLEINHML